jgi:glycosyltransferase involved in cell wall biosynthesis
VASEAPGDLISVIVPAFNAEKYIAETLRSITRQTYREIEVIVVDDGSTDGTVPLVEAAITQDARISLLRSAHRGVSSARNLGIAKARGELLAPIDADDLWTSDKLQRQFELLRNSEPDTGVVYCWAAGIDDDGKIVLPVWNASRARGDVLHEIVQSGILSCGSTPLIRKQYALQAGGFDEALPLSEDWKFYTALAGVCRFEVIPECLTGYRIRSDSTSVNIEPMEEALRACTRWIEAKWPDLPPHVMKGRAFTLETYLAFMAIRAGKYGAAARYLVRAVKTKPAGLFDPLFWELAALIPAHAAGLRRYEVALWRSPRKFADQ